MDKKFFTYENLDELLFGGKKITEIINDTDFTLNDFHCYLPLDGNKFKDLKLNYQYLILPKMGSPVLLLCQQAYRI